MAREKPFTHNAMTDLLRRTQLDVGDLDRFAPSARTLTPTVAPRILGSTFLDITSGGALTMRYVRMNNVAHAWFKASNPRGGVAPWVMELPVQPSALGVDYTPVGQWVARKSGTVVMDGWIILTLNAGTYYGVFEARNTAGPVAPSFAGPLYPWDWSASPGLPVWSIAGNLHYECADAYTP